MTIPVDGANNPPTVGGIDEDNLCAYVRLGERVRATAVAEFAGYDASHTPADFRSCSARSQTCSRAAATMRGRSIGRACGR